MVQGPGVATGAAAGLAVRIPHARELLDRQPALGLAELLADNHLAPGGPARLLARRVALTYPVALHAVGTSLGGPDPLDRSYLLRLRTLAEELDARWVSDHVSFSSWHGSQLHDLLPVPYSEESLKHISCRIDISQDLLGRRMLVENPSRYLPLAAGEMGEAEFLNELVRRTGCGLLVDVNNAYVNQINLGISAAAFIDELAVADIGYVHIAGHSVRGDYLVDTHGSAVAEPVWQLLERLLYRRPDLTVIIERDRSLPPLDELLDEVTRATLVSRKVVSRAA